jgi:hypothetical protein
MYWLQHEGYRAYRIHPKLADKEKDENYWFSFQGHK